MDVFKHASRNVCKAFTVCFKQLHIFGFERALPWRRNPSEIRRKGTQGLRKKPILQMQRMISTKEGGDIC